MIGVYDKKLIFWFFKKSNQYLDDTVLIWYFEPIWINKIFIRLFWWLRKKGIRLEKKISNVKVLEESQKIFLEATKFYWRISNF